MKNSLVICVSVLYSAVQQVRGNFSQGGNKASFGSSGNFVIAFMGSGQTAHIDDVGYSRFANIDPDHSSVKMKDEPLVFVANMGISIGKGVVSGLQEALGDLELSAAAAAVSTAIGVSLSALSSPGVAAVVSIITLIAGVIGTIQSLFMIAQAAGGIYSTATGTGTVYDKAEAFAHDFIIMVVGIVSLVGSVKAIQSSLAAFKSAAQELFGRKSRLTPSEVTQTFQGTKLITSFEEFTEYTKGYLDDDALQYVKEVLNKDADDIAKLKKVAQLVEDGSRKIGKKLSKEELKAGLDAFWNDSGVGGALAAIERVFKGDEYISIWNKIVATAENIKNTEIPATFQVELNVKISYVNPETGTNVLWANANATKHMGEYVFRLGETSQSIGVRSQLMLESFHAALNEAMEKMISKPLGRQRGNYGNWELGINTKTGVIYRAKMLY